MREAAHHERTAHSESADTELAALRAENEAAHTDADALRAELGSARAELGAKAAELGDANAQLARTQAELETAIAAAEDIRAEREQARLRAEQLTMQAEQARAAAEAIRAELDFEAPENGAAPESPAARKPWSVPTAPAAAENGSQSDPAKPELPVVGAGEAAALIALDGSFKRLDESFCSLLGCREEDLRAARWPSIIDRENLKAHQEIARALKAGELQSAEVETVYMHAQGLLVPIAGTISMHHAQPGGEPHFLFRADVSRTAGVPGLY